MRFLVSQVRLDFIGRVSPVEKKIYVWWGLTRRKQLCACVRYWEDCGCLTVSLAFLVVFYVVSRWEMYCSLAFFVTKKCNLFPHEHQGVHKNSFRNVRAFQDRTEIWKCWFLRRGKNRSTRRKTSRSRVENQQQTQPTYDAGSGNRTRATAVGGERSHHCAIPVPCSCLIQWCMMCVMEVSRISMWFLYFCYFFGQLIFSYWESCNAPVFILFSSRLRLFGRYLGRLELVLKYFPWTFGACFQDGGQTSCRDCGKSGV